MMNDHLVADADVPIVSEKETTLELIPGSDQWRCGACKSYIGQRHFECPLGRSKSKGCPQCSYVIDGKCEMCGIDLPKSKERLLLEELLSIVDEVNEHGEPTIGHDHTGAVNWLLEFADRVRVTLAASPPSV